MPWKHHTHIYTLQVGCNCGDTGMGAADACEEGLRNLIESGSPQQYEVLEIREDVPDSDEEVTS